MNEWYDGMVIDVLSVQMPEGTDPAYITCPCSFCRAWKQKLIAMSTTPASDTSVVGESWPKDSLHDAARRVVGGMNDLAPDARQAVRKASEKADAPLTGRAAQDNALGRALRWR